MKKLRTVCVALFLALTLTFATVPTVMANGDVPQDNKTAPGGTPETRPTPPPTPPLDPIIIIIIIIINGV